MWHHDRHGAGIGDLGHEAAMGDASRPGRPSRRTASATAASSSTMNTLEPGADTNATRSEPSLPAATTEP